MIDSILHFFSNINIYVWYIIFFLFAFFEFLVFTWWIIPGTFMLILGWVLVKFGFYSFKFMVLAGFLWSFLWSYISYKYWVDKWKLVLVKWYKFLKPSFFSLSKKIFNQYHFFSLLFWKLIPGVKESISFIAGIFHLDFYKFLFFNFLNSFLWAFFTVLLGYLFSFSFEIAYLWFGRIALVLLFIFFILLIFAIIRYYLLYFGKLFLKLFNAFLDYLFPSKWLLKVIKYKYFLIFLLLFLVVYLIFAYIGFLQVLYKHPIMLYMDESLSNLLFYFQNPRLTNFMLFVSFWWKLLVILLLSVIFSYYLYRKKQYNIILGMYVSILLTTIVVFLTKIIVARHRPDIALYITNTYSFPSSHTALSIVFYWFIFYYFFKISSTWNSKVNKILLFLLIIFLISFSRLYLQVHYFSDILWGIFIGFIGLLLWIFLTEVKVSYKIIIPKFLLYFSVIFLLFYLFNYISFVKFRQFRQVGQYIDKFEPINNINEYFKKHTSLLFTTTIVWRKTEPINFIFLAKNDDSLYKLFIESWFLPADKLSFINFSKLGLAVYDNIPYKTAPMTPLFWNKKVQLFWFQKQEWNLEKRHHIRIWKTDLMYKNYYVYVASAVYDTNIKWKITHKISPNLNKEREYFLKNLKKTKKITVKKLKLLPSITGKNFSYDNFYSDWFVYLITIEY